jgi:hypothetical protein
MAISVTVRQLVRERARQRCEYCQTAEWLSGIANEIDHIIPLAAGGTDDLDNLCLACPVCNGRKWAKTRAVDPTTGATVALFHPRQQLWSDHFAWSEDSKTILGLTVCGRATIQALQMNHELIVAARAIWVRVKLHPPVE